MSPQKDFQPTSTEGGKRVGRPRGAGLKAFDVPRPAADQPAGEAVHLDVRNGEVIVDEKWLPYLQQFSWQREPSGYTKRGDWYRDEQDKVRNRTVRMHVDIVQPGPGLVVDHINGNKKDNRESNLRAVHPSINSRNSTSRVSNGYGFKGVQYSKQHQCFIAVISVYGRRFSRQASTAQEAAHAYDELARQHFGATGRYNFPRPGERGLNGAIRVEGT